MTRIDNLAKSAGRRAFSLLPIPIKRQIHYFRVFKRLIPRNPQTFLDKVQWRILHDRRPLIAVGGDKLSMKEYAASASSVRIPETLWAGPNISSILDEQWEGDWVFKPREGSGYVAFGNGSLRSAGVTPETIARWRHKDHFRVQGVWGYGQTEPGYLIEKQIPTPDGEPPNDLRFFVFDGAVRLIQIDTPRFSGVQRRFYTPDWEPYDVIQGKASLGEVLPRPHHLDQMLRFASEVGAAFDFVRVDLYDTPDGVYFGEITPYPTGGLSRFSDEGFDRMLGDWWTLPTRSEVKF